MFSQIKMVGIALWMLLILFYPVDNLSAENAGAEYLVRTGVLELKKGNEKGAIHELSKALLLEPENEEALYYLKQLGAPGGIYADSPSHPYRLSKVNQALEAYENKVAQLEYDKQQLEQRLHRALMDQDIVFYQGRDIINNSKSPTLAHHMDEVNGIDTAHKKYPVLKRSSWHVQDTKYMKNPQPVINVSAVPDPTDKPFNNDQTATYEGYHDLQTLLADNATEELSYHIMLEEDPEGFFYAQYSHQDKMINLLSDYLKHREGELENTKDDLVMTKIDLQEKELEMIKLVSEMEKINQDYEVVMALVEREEVATTGGVGMNDLLQEQLDQAQNEINIQDAVINEQDLYLASLQQQLQDSHKLLERLISEREMLLEQAQGKVDDTQGKRGR